MRPLLLGWVVVGLATMSLAASFDYANKGSIGASTATLTGSVKAGGSLTLTSPLISTNSASAMGTVIIQTGILVSTKNPGVFDFTGGSLTVDSKGKTLFHGTFSSATVTLSGSNTFSIEGKLDDGTVFLTEMDKHGDVDGDTSLVTPEPNTLSLLGTGVGLIGIAALVRRRKPRGLRS